MIYFFGAIPKFAAVDSDIVAFGGKAGTNFVYTLFRPTGDKRIDHVRNESHAHYLSLGVFSNNALSVWSCSTRLVENRGIKPKTKYPNQ
jgi:hypothetical protein